MSSAAKRNAVIIIHTRGDSKTAGGTVEDLCKKAFQSIQGWNYSLVAAGFRPDGYARSAVQDIKDPYKSSKTTKAVDIQKADAVIVAGVRHLRQPGIVDDALAKIDKGAGLVIGSRRAAGGAWAGRPRRHRKPRSRIESFLVRAALFFPTGFWFKATDPTSGFMAFKPPPGSAASRAITDYVHIHRPPFALLCDMIREHAKVYELPVQADDEPGDLKRVAATVKSALQLRWRAPETKRFLKFCAVGFTGYVINASALEFFRNVNLTNAISRYFAAFPRLSRFSLITSQSAWSAALAAEIAIVSNYLLNIFWTFSRHRIHRPLKFVGKLLQFNLTSFGGVVIQFFVVGLATRVAGDTPLVRAAALVFAVVFLIIPYNWTMYNRVIWRVKRGETNGEPRV